MLYNRHCKYLLINSRHQPRQDVAYLLSADSDQAATSNYMRQFFSKKSLITVSPPNKPISNNVANYADGIETAEP